MPEKRYAASPDYRVVFTLGNSIESTAIVKTNRTFWLMSILALGAVTIALAACMPWYRLPDPRTADCEGLFRWLVQTDLATEPIETQLVLVDRFAEELRSGMKPPEDRSRLSVLQTERLSANIELLERIWFAARVDRLFEIAPNDRADFLDEQIATVFCWCHLETPREEPPRLEPARDESPRHEPAADPEPAADHAGNVGAFFTQIERWIDGAVPPAQERMRRAVRLGVARWLAVHDLAHSSPATRSLLAERIARELDKGMTPSSVLADLAPEQRATLEANAEMLLEAWFLDRADDYFNAPDEQKNAFIDAQIDRLSRWPIDSVLASDAADGSAPSTGKLAMMIRVSAMVEVWIARAAPERQQRLRDLITAAQLRMLSRPSRKI